jgi:hypothetical protein
MKRVVFFLCFILVVFSNGLARADLAMFKVHDFQSAAGATGNGTPLAVDNYSTVGLQVVISDTAEVTFEVTSDGTNWVSTVCTQSNDTAGTLVTSASASAAFQCNVAGYQQFRVRVSSFTGGTVTVSGRASTAVLGRKGGGGGGSQGLDDVIAVDRTYGGAVSQATAPRFGDSGSNEYWSLFRDPTAGLIFTCEVGGVLDDCHKGTKLLNGKFYRIKNQSDVTVLEVDHTGAITEGSLNAETAGVSVTLYQPLCGGDFVGVDPAAGTAVHIWDKSPLDTAPTATAVTGTNQTYGVARFPDSDGDVGVQLTCFLPPGFTGQLDAVAWGKTTGTGNFRLQISTKCYASDTANDAAFNTASVFTMAAGTSGRLNRYALSNITITGCAADQLLMVRAFRNRTEASDTLNNTFDLKSLRLWARNTY